MTLESITKELSQEAISPGRLTELHRFLAAEYSFTSARLEEILKVEDGAWLEMRKTLGSDKATDKAWGATEEGINLKVYKQTLRRIEKLMASCRLSVDTAKGESMNQF